MHIDSIAQQRTGKSISKEDTDAVQLPLKRQEQSLIEDLEAYTERAVKEKVISRHEADSVMSFIRDSLPETQELRISTLKALRDRIDMRYDNLPYSTSEITPQDYTYIASRMLPGILKEPEGFIDPFEKRHKSEMAAAMKVKEIATMHFAQDKAPVPKWSIMPLRLLFNNGMDTSGKTISVHGGLYYIPIPPGKPQTSIPWTKTTPKAYDDN